MKKTATLLLIPVSLFISTAPVEAREARADFSVPRTNVYVGEKMPLKLIIRSSGAGIGSNITLAGLPPADEISFGQFKEARVDRKKQSSNQTIERREFTTTATFHRQGRIKLSPRLRLSLIEMSRSPFGFARTRTSELLDLPPIEFNVQPLPSQGRPENYTGAIGTFSLNVSISPTNFAPGELIEITAAIAGTGNLEQAEIRLLDSAPMFKVYDPKTIDSVPGRKQVLKQIVIPQKPSANRIPEISFSFFDPNPAEYKTLSDGPFALNYNPAMQTEKPENLTGAIQQPPPDKYEPGLSRPEKKSDSLIVLAVSVFWIAAFILAVGARMWLKPSLLWAGVILAAALLAFPAFKQKAEYLLTLKEKQISESTEARIYPAPGAAPTFRLRPGQSIKVIENRGNWAKIEATGKRGWIPASTLSD